MKIYAGKSQYVAAGTTSGVTLHAKAGKVRAIFASGAASGAVTLYDNASGFTNVLLVVNVTTALPFYICLDRLMPIYFTSGLGVKTAAGVDAFIITEV